MCFCILLVGSVCVAGRSLLTIDGDGCLLQEPESSESEEESDDEDAAVRPRRNQPRNEPPKEDSKELVRTLVARVLCLLRP